MSLPRNLFATSFRRQRIGSLFTAVVGFMVFAATIAVAAETALSAVTLTWDSSVKSRMTVEIPAVEDEANMSQADRVKQSLAILRAMPDVAEAVPVPDSETTRLLQPWITDPELLKSLPIPALIDVVRRAGSVLPADVVRDHLKSVVPDIKVDDHAAWLMDLARLVRGLVAIGGVMMLLAALTLGIAVSFFCRAVMSSERNTVTLLHIMGADDDDIARHFETLARRMATVPALCGFLAAACITILLAFGLQRFSILGPLDITGSFMLGFGVVLVPCLAILISAATARMSVLAHLRSMP
jgi:cell division transport system permease protein